MVPLDRRHNFLFFIPREVYACLSQHGLQQLTCGCRFAAVSWPAGDVDGLLHGTQRHGMLLFGISGRLLRRLQSVQNAAARLVTGAHRCDHITPVLRQLHWLPVRQHVVFKIAGLVHQSLVGLAPAYLADDCRLLSDVGRRPLRSNSNDMRNCLCHEHITNSVIGVSRPPVLDYGTTFHLDSGGRDLPLTLLDNL